MGLEWLSRSWDHEALGRQPGRRGRKHRRHRPHHSRSRGCGGSNVCQPGIGLRRCAPVPFRPRWNRHRPGEAVNVERPVAWPLDRPPLRDRGDFPGSPRRVDRLTGIRPDGRRGIGRSLATAGRIAALRASSPGVLAAEPILPVVRQLRRGRPPGPLTRSRGLAIWRSGC